jgi:hypothetical protein
MLLGRRFASKGKENTRYMDMIKPKIINLVPFMLGLDTSFAVGSLLSMAPLVPSKVSNNGFSEITGFFIWTVGWMTREKRQDSP